MQDKDVYFILGPIVLALLGLAVTQLFLYIFTRKAPLPPGPTGKFFSGNVHQLPKSEPWRTYADWKEKYGSVVYFRVYNQKYVLLNSAKAAVDLLESRSAIYSDRPIVWMGKELVGRSLNVFNISSQNPRFRTYRKQLHSGLNNRAMQSYLPLLNQQTHVLLGGLGSSPDDFISHIRRNAAAVILKITYGWTVTKNDDEFVNIMQEVGAITAYTMQPGKWFVDVLPWLRFVPAWMPGAGFQRKAADAKERLSRLDRIPFNWCKEQIKSGNYIESFASKGLLPDDNKPVSHEDEDVVKWCSAALYAGGADTTISAMTTFFLMMTLHPHVQQRAQAEIERVIGKDKLPTIEDQKDLPYATAIIKEVLRWSPVAPLGLHHRLTQEDEYKGHRIPEGTTVIANIWAITHDSELYPEPSTFDPDRFISTPGAEAQVDPRRWVFGFGRRVCPGAHFADTCLFLNVTSVLATFNISKALDQAGREIDPEVGFTTGVTSHVKPFNCRIIPRSSDLLASLNLS